MLRSDRSNEALQGDLFDLLGGDRFDFILELLDKREMILVTAIDQAVKGLHKVRAPARQGPLMTGISVHSEDEKRIAKATRKEENRATRAGPTADDDVLAALGWQSAPEQAAAPPPLFTTPWTPVVKYPYVFDSLAASPGAGSGAYVSGMKVLLPRSAPNAKMKRCAKPCAFPPVNRRRREIGSVESP